MDSFDYVVVGAGAAGAIVASRLSEDANVSVCLLEAGGKGLSPWLHIPAGFIKAVKNPAVTWQFAAEPTALTGNRPIAIPQGRTLGGTTAINGLIYNRGQATDYDAWATLGIQGWSYEEVLPYFKRSERWIGNAPSAYHGVSGKIAVSESPLHPSLCEAFINAAVQQGMERNADYNGASQAGVGYFQRTIDGRWRSNVSNTYLKEARSRPNLTIITHAQAHSLQMQDRTVTGVHYRREGSANEQVVAAKREVILSCGAINTPRLLELSGIGAGSRLNALGISVRHDLPGVGENLCDHYGVRIVARVRNQRTINELTRGLALLGQIGRWALNRPSLLAVSPSIVYWFAQSKFAQGRPDLQGVFTPASYKEGAIGVLDDFPGMTAGVWPHRPRSRGFVHITSPDANTTPCIQPNYLHDAHDRAVLTDGIRQARALLQAPALAPYFVEETMPGPAIQSDMELLEFAGQFGASAQHLVGTARMGVKSDPSAVVDASLRVIGLKGLRIADASVIPIPPSANTCATAMMIGERAAKLIQDDTRQ